MINTLSWAHKPHEDYVEIVANIVNIRFNNNTFYVNYYVEAKKDIFLLYLDCNNQMFKIGEYSTLDETYKRANDYHKKFVTSFTRQNWASVL